jgi:hypothetical protein
VPNRDELKEYLSSKGIGTLIQWGGKAVHEFKDLGFCHLHHDHGRASI